MEIKVQMYIILSFIFISYLCMKIDNITKKLKILENFDATADAITAAVNAKYTADIDAIRTLSSIAKKLNEGGLTCPGILSMNKNQLRLYDITDDHHYVGYNSTVNGPALVGWSGGKLGTTEGGDKTALQWDSGTNVKINGSLRIGSWTIRDQGGHLQFVKDGTDYKDNYNDIPNNSGFFAFSQDGNIWMCRDTGPKGWIGENKISKNGGTINGTLNVNGVFQIIDAAGSVKGKIYDDGNMHIWTDDVLNLDAGSCTNLSGNLWVRGTGNNNVTVGTIVKSNRNYPGIKVGGWTMIGNRGITNNDSMVWINDSNNCGHLTTGGSFKGGSDGVV
jgi:hypothetical protein